MAEMTNPERAAPAADSSGVRVRLAPASGGADQPPIRIDRPDRGVLAQRHLLVDGEPRDLALRATGGERFVLEQGGARARVLLGPPQVAGGVTHREVLVAGFRFQVEIEPERIAALRERATRGRSASTQTGPLEVRAVIPGKVASVSVAVGDAVTAGQQLLVVEAMKMQNELRAPRDGTIDSVGVAPGANIEVGDLLLVMS